MFAFSSVRRSALDVRCSRFLPFGVGPSMFALSWTGVGSRESAREIPAGYLTDSRSPTPVLIIYLLRPMKHAIVSS